MYQLKIRKIRGHVNAEGGAVSHAPRGMNLAFGTRSMSASRPNVKFGNSTRIINIPVVLLFPTFALGAGPNGIKMLETNHWVWNLKGFL
ncbi:hypothetical protein CHELA17_61539 [Chelatococcus asaccharovorans]|nr:hypothetical protein CHELA17_61539 [Chelatococcus asaccharovorans]